MTESRYLNFIKEDVPNRKTAVYRVVNGDRATLGFISFFPAWRKFVFMPTGGCIFDSACLSDIIVELNDLTAEWRASLNKEK